MDLSPGETLILPAGWMHGIRCKEESPAVLVGGHFRHSLDIKVQFRYAHHTICPISQYKKIIVNIFLKK